MLGTKSQKAFCSFRATGPCIRPETQGSSLPVCFVCFPDRKEREREVWSGSGCGANSSAAGAGTGLEAGDSHAPAYSTSTASALGKPVRDPSLSWNLEQKGWEGPQPELDISLIFTHESSSRPEALPLTSATAATFGGHEDAPGCLFCPYSLPARNPCSTSKT